MKVAVAQSRPVKGEFDRNMESHVELAEAAAAAGADTLVFPELSLTGYEPTLAARFAVDP